MPRRILQISIATEKLTEPARPQSAQTAHLRTKVGDTNGAATIWFVVWQKHSMTVGLDLEFLQQSGLEALTVQAAVPDAALAWFGQFREHQSGRSAASCANCRGRAC